ncbi:MAG: NAD(P)/FAD-dependent oxidoreductase [Methermicoccaceae archaeon]
MTAKRVLIVGAGTAGIVLSNKLARDLRREIAGGKLEVLLLDKSDIYTNAAVCTFLPFDLYTTEEASRPTRSLLSPRVKLLSGDKGEVVNVDLEKRSVKTKDGSSYTYDWLVLATGYTFHPEVIPGLLDDYHTFYTVEDALKLREEIRNFTGGKVVVYTPKMPISCPGAPGKFTFILDDYLRYVKKLEDYSITQLWPAPSVGPPTYFKNAQENVARRGINLMVNYASEKVDAKEKKVIGAEGSEDVEYDLLISIPPHMGHPLYVNSEIADNTGWLPADPNTLRYGGNGFPTHDDVYVLGDGGPSPRLKTGISTHYQALNAAQNIINEYHGTGSVQLYRGEMGCPYVESSYTDGSSGAAYIAVWTYNNPTPPFRGIGLGWLLYRMYYHTYWDGTMKALL